MGQTEHWTGHHHGVDRTPSWGGQGSGLDLMSRWSPAPYACPIHAPWAATSHGTRHQPRPDSDPNPNPNSDPPFNVPLQHTCLSVDSLSFGVPQSCPVSEAFTPVLSSALTLTLA